MGPELVVLLILVCTNVSWSAGKHPERVFDAYFDQPMDSIAQLIGNAYRDNEKEDAIELHPVLKLQSRSTGMSHKKSLDPFKTFTNHMYIISVNLFVIRSRFGMQFQEWSSARWNLRAHWRNKQ